MPVKVVESNLNVLQAAKIRIRNVFANGCKIYLSFSSGKDSLCMANLVYEMILSGELDPKQLTVTFIDESADVYGTITHNRARGTHLLEPMKAIVKKLIDEGKTVEEIGKQLGMKPEEIFRLSGFTKDEFLNMMTKGHDTYSKAQVIRSV